MPLMMREIEFLNQQACAYQPQSFHPIPKRMTLDKVEPLQLEIMPHRGPMSLERPSQQSTYTIASFCKPLQLLQLVRLWG